MEYSHSKLLDPSEYETEGLCDGLPVRKHVAEELEEIGSFQAQEDWNNLVSPISGFKGGLGPIHSFMSLSLPECLPNRFEVVSYANEFAFLHDDVTDILDQQNGNVEKDEVLDALCEGAKIGKIEALKSGKRQMQAKILNTMMSIDRPRALTAMRAWATFVEQGAGRQHHHHFHTLEEYLPYRSRDVGAMFWQALVTFGCAITIAEKEQSTYEDLVLPAVLAASLTNDLFSYEKEYEAAQTAGLPNVINALWVLMEEHSISLEEAKVLCRKRIKEEVSKYARVVEESRTRRDLSSDAKKCIELMQYSVSGNVVWSLQCPRYHKDIQYNERQVLRGRYDVTGSVASYHPAGHMERRSSDSVRIVTAKTRRVENACTHHTRTNIDAGPGLTYEKASQGVFPTEVAGDLQRKSNIKHLWDVTDFTHCTGLRSLSEDVLLDPYRYLSSLPTKGIRDMAIDGPRLWLHIAPQSIAIIRTVINMIHNSSIMLDDIQDGSQLRRGGRSTHVVYGEAQTINAATYQYVQAVAEVRRLQNPMCMEIFIDEMRSLFVGQGFDVHWTNSGYCPSVLEYLQMVDGKTGSLFRLLVRSMLAESSNGERADFDRLCRLLGRYFQIRDDYQNLASREYMSQKNFCEDLDEGKFSLPLIHALHHTAEPMQLQDILRQHCPAGKCTLEQKQRILKQMHQTGSLEFTL